VTAHIAGVAGIIKKEQRMRQNLPHSPLMHKGTFSSIDLE